MSTSEGKSESVAETSDEATKPPVEAYRTLCSHYSRGCSLVVNKIHIHVAGEAAPSKTGEEIAIFPGLFALRLSGPTINRVGRGLLHR